jgi:hypothetical protein
MANSSAASSAEYSAKLLVRVPSYWLNSASITPAAS